MRTKLPVPSVIFRTGRGLEPPRPMSAATSQTRAVASSLAERSRWPSGEKARAVMLPRWALTRPSSFRAATSQSRIASSRPGKRGLMSTPVARILPSGENARALNWFSGPSRRPSSRPDGDVEQEDEAVARARRREDRAVGREREPGADRSGAVVRAPCWGARPGASPWPWRRPRSGPSRREIVATDLPSGANRRALMIRAGDARLGHAGPALTRRRVPENHAVVPRRGQRLAIGREVRAFDNRIANLAGQLKPAQLAPGGHVPEPGGLEAVAGRQGLAVGRERGEPKSDVAGLELADLLPGGRVPEADGPVMPDSHDRSTDRA